MTEHREHDERPSPASRPRARGVSTGMWWLLSFCILLGTEPRWLTSKARVIDSGELGSLAPDWAWTVPLSTLPGIGQMSEWPYWLFCIVGSGLMALVCRRVAGAGAFPAALLLVVGGSLTMSPNQLIPAALAVTATSIAASPRGSRRGWLAAVFVVASVLVSVEFGFVLLHLGLMFLGGGFRETVEGRPDPVPSPPPGEKVAEGRMRGRDQPPAERANFKNRRFLVTAIATVAAMAALVVAHVAAPGFAAAAMRPASWLWIRPDEMLLPSGAPTLRLAQLGTGTVTMMLFIAVCWLRAARSNDARDRPSLPGLCVFSALGLACSRYLWMSGFAIAAMFRLADSRKTTPRIGRPVVVGCMVIAGIRLAAHYPFYADYFAAGTVHQHLVQPVEWGTTGTVMLMDLDQSRHWQTPQSAGVFRLLVDDRWDVFGNLYPEYANVCRDLAEVRSDSYLRTDGRWGGYQRWLKQWEPALLVVGSDRLEDIRRLSLSPHWKVLGIDEQRTIFGRDDDRGNSAQRVRARNVLTGQEWPRQPGAVSDSRVLVANDPSAARRVASVLCAIRFPYAALRVLPDDHDGSTERQRTWSYLELAHRVRRYTGTASLLDQYRAVHRLRQARRESWWSHDDLSRATRGLSSLGVPVSDSEAARAAETGSAGGADGPADDPEQQLRLAMIHGDRETSHALIQELDAAVRPYYTALASAVDREPSELSDALASAIQAPDFPDRLLGEALFYHGCLAIEIGDPKTATRALGESLRVDPSSPYGPIRDVYLQQLTRR